MRKTDVQKAASARGLAFQYTKQHSAHLLVAEVIFNGEIHTYDVEYGTLDATGLDILLDEQQEVNDARASGRLDAILKESRIKLRGK